MTPRLHAQVSLFRGFRTRLTIGSPARSSAPDAPADNEGVLEFCDKPYRFYPPRYSPPIAWLLKRYNRRRYLPRTKRIIGVEVQNAGEFQAMTRPGDRIVLLPNHPTHADAAILLEALRQVGLSTQVMAAYDVFLRSRLDAWVMQKLGAFSVDREGSDQAAIKQAMATLGAGRFALTIFPEGNVYLENDAVTPFNEGAAFIALKSAQALAEKGHRVVVVPVSIKTTHVTDARAELTGMIRDLAAALQVEIESGATPLAALKQVGLAALRRNLEHRGYEIGADAPRALRPFIEQTAGAVVSRLEAKLKLQPRGDESLTDRIRRCRRAIHEVRTDESRAVDHAAAATWADEAMLAFKIASYSGKYVTASPTLDRISETVEKLSEDLYNRVTPPIGPKHAYVRFNRPIDATERLSGGVKLRQAVRDLTADAEGAVQDGLYQINAGNQHPGAALWSESLG